MHQLRLKCLLFLYMIDTDRSMGGSAQMGFTVLIVDDELMPRTVLCLSLIHI